MKICFLLHIPAETPGFFLEHFYEHRFNFKFVKTYDGHSMPELDDFDCLVIMGGPMSVHDELPWLEQERELISKAVGSEKKVVGICLGAQQIALSLGAEVFKSQIAEIGWNEVKLVRGGVEKVFQWHQEEFSLPNGAELLASSSACENQAFLYGSNVLAIQFHPEATPELIEGMIDEFKPDLDTSGWSAQELCTVGNELLAKLLQRIGL